MEDKISYLEVCDGRANLPIDLHKIKQTVEVSGAASVEEAATAAVMTKAIRFDMGR